MYLQGDEAAGISVVDKVGASDAVDPSADAVADSFHAGGVPLVVLEGALGGHVLDHGIEPASTGFVINATRPGACAGVYLELIAVDAAVLIVLAAVAAELNAGVEVGINEELEFEDEVGLVLLGTEERVVGIGLGVAHDGAVHDFVSGLASALGPTAEVFAVEEGRPGLSGEGRRNDK